MRLQGGQLASVRSNRIWHRMVHRDETRSRHPSRGIAGFLGRLEWEGWVWRGCGLRVDRGEGPWGSWPVSVPVRPADVGGAAGYCKGGGRGNEGGVSCPGDKCGKGLVWLQSSRCEQEFV